MKKTFTYEEAFKQSLEYFNGADYPATVYLGKYAVQNDDGFILEPTPNFMHDRLANEFARIDAEKYGENFEERFEVYRNAIDKFARIVPQGSPMAAIGNPYKLMSASNCVVVESPHDSIEGIMTSGLDLAQLMKRRCVEANSKIITKERGVIPISDVEVGMHVLSFDIKTRRSLYKKVLDKFTSEVNEADRIVIKYSNGTLLKTSKKHPVLTMINGEYDYKYAGDIAIGDVNVRPIISNQYDYIPSEFDDLGWLIGAHLGDGSCDYHLNKQTKQYPGGPRTYEYPKYRFRIAGDNEAVIAAFTKIFNNRFGSSCNYHISSRKDYKVPVWEFSCARGEDNKKIIDTYFDGKFGKKVYTATIPSFIKKNNLWWSAIAGLIDTDGSVKNFGEAINLTLTSKELIDEISCFLQSKGVSIQTGVRENTRINEQQSYRLTINYSPELWQIFASLMKHDLKVAALISRTEHRFMSRQKPLTKDEVTSIINKYNEIKKILTDDFKVRNLLAANIYNLKKNESIGLGAINCFLEHDLISRTKADEIIQRTIVKTIEEDKLSSCYVDIEVEDTNNFYCGNFGFVVIHNCGVGLDISTLRPDGYKVNNAAKTTSGAWSFADFFSYVTRMIAQNGRRGALMITLDVHHPDVVKFATMKQDLTKVTGANVSIRLSDKFLKAVEEDSEYEQRWPCEGEAKYSQMVKARDVWNVIVDCATKTAEPGLIMWDNMINNLPAHCYPDFATRSTNPCSEIALSAYDSCRLISINLTGYVKNAFDQNAYFDFDLFKSDVKIAMQMCDNLVDLELELITKIKEKCSAGHETELWNKLYKAGEKGRRTGLGTHGLADTLAQIKIKYDSNEALEFAEKLYKTLRDTAYEASIELAEKRGSFPVFNWDLEKDCEFIKRLPKKLKERMAKSGRRNIALLTQAPTGSVSSISKVGEFNKFNVSSGVEPVFRNSFTRRKKINPNDINAKVDFIDVVGDKWQEFKIYHPNVQNYLEKFNLKNDSELPSYFITSDKIDWEKRVQLQGVEQQFIDHSISSTINLPKGTQPSVVGDLYLKSWKHGLKGVTVYVDGSRDGVLISNDEKKEKEEIKQNISERPRTLSAETHKIKIDTGDGELKNAYITVSFFPDSKKPYEVFINAPIGNDLKDLQILELSSRMSSLALRHGVPAEFVANQLMKVDGQYVYSIPTSLSKALRSYSNKVLNESEEELQAPSNIENQDCKHPNLIFEEGCNRCPDCGYSGCS